jgi:hypothetical protein
MYSLKLIGFDMFDNGPSADELLAFAAGALVIVFLLLLYYQRIAKKTNLQSPVEKPLYTYKDILLQPKSVEDKNFPVSKELPLALRIIAISLIFLIIITPLYKLFNVQHFV